MLGSIGFTELLFIFLIVVVLFGASRIPEIGRGLGSGIQNLTYITYFLVSGAIHAANPM